MRSTYAVIVLVLLSGCTQTAPNAAPAATSTPFLDTVEAPAASPTITAQAEEAQRRNEGGSEARIQAPSKTRRELAEESKRRAATQGAEAP